MVSVRAVPVVALLQVGLLLVLGWLLGWGASGPGATAWVAAFASLAVVGTGAAHLARSTRPTALGPADLVTLTRATLTCGVVGLVAESLAGPDHRAGTLAVLASLSLALDGVDGEVVRRTGTGSAFGARLDGEADAYLLLVLSAWVAPVAGWWVLAIGLARYLFAVAGWFLPWMRAKLPFRSWRKVVTATAGIILAVAAAELVPAPLVTGALLVAALLIGESFGRDVWWLWRHRHAAAGRPVAGVSRV